MKNRHPEVIDGIEAFPLPGWEGIFSVTKCGRIWSHPRTIIRSNGWKQKFKGRWRKLAPHSGGYLTCSLASQERKAKHYLVHRLVASALVDGYCEELQVDHVDGDRTNNFACNLRMATHSENQRNKKGKNQIKGGSKGVTKSKKNLANPWVAQITVEGKAKNLGYYRTEEEAALAYDGAASAAFGEFARTNN